jgi:hypothetical protein
VLLGPGPVVSAFSNYSFLILITTIYHFALVICIYTGFMALFLLDRHAIFGVMDTHLCFVASWD